MEAFLTPPILIAIAIIGQAIASFVDKPVQDRIGSIRMMWGTWIGFQVALVFAAAFQLFFHSILPTRIDATVVILLLAINVLATTNFVLYMKVLERESVSYAVSATSLHPIVTVLLGVMILGEPLHLKKVFAISCALAAVYMLGQTRVTERKRGSYAIIAAILILSGTAVFLDKILVAKIGTERLFWAPFMSILTVPLVLLMRDRFLLRKNERPLIPETWKPGWKFHFRFIGWAIVTPLLPLIRAKRPQWLPPFPWNGTAMTLLTVKAFAGWTGLVCMWVLFITQPVSSVAPAVSVYPALTAILGFIILKERPTFIKCAAIVLAIVSVVLLARP